MQAHTSHWPSFDTFIAQIEWHIINAPSNKTAHNESQRSNFFKVWPKFPADLEVTLRTWLEWPTFKRGGNSITSPLLTGQLCKLTPIDQYTLTFCFEALRQTWLWFSRFWKTLSVYTYALRNPMRSWVWIVYKENAFPLLLCQRLKDHTFGFGLPIAFGYLTSFGVAVTDVGACIVFAAEHPGEITVDPWLPLPWSCPQRWPATHFLANVIAEQFVAGVLQDCLPRVITL